MPTAISSTAPISPLQPSQRTNMPKFGDVGVQGGPPEKQPAKRVVSALAVQAGAKKGKRLSAVGVNIGSTSAPMVSMEVMNNNFEEWMKLATDNKITATNTWKFALIDYFADLTLLRNGPDDQSINFQKASATLDGCVKVWTSRVDSVATETGRLLSGLTGGGGTEEERDEGVEGDEEEASAEGPVKRKTTSHRSEATLAKSFAALQVKKFDLEFTVDPLFKKTCADFDEGGAMGLLMNHLGVDGKGRVVFDAGDAGVEEDQEEVQEEEEEMVDLTKLREFIPSLEKTMELNISDTLSTFRFSADPNSMPDFSTLVSLRDSFDDDPRLAHGFEGTPAPTGDVQDFFGDEDFDMGGPVGFDDVVSAAGDEEGVVGDHYGGGGVGMVAPGDRHAPFDPRRVGQQLVIAVVAGDDEEGMFDYFDRGLGKAWAGAEHWKLRKVSRKDTAAPATKVARTAKTPFQIDFLNPSAAQSSKTLFASAPRSSLCLPSSSKGPRRSSKKNDAKNRREEWLLPDDMHFSSRQLLRLFLKPQFSLRMRRNATAARMAENPNGEIDENFWAQAAAERADLPDDSIAMDHDSAPIPFESQFFHDDPDDAFVDDAIGPAANGDGDADDLWQGTQGKELKKSRPENVNFAKKAKRVDVKRLKDDIWSGLRTLVPDKGSDEDEVPTTPAEEAPVRTFDAIIQDLRTTYPQDKMSEISTSFCFICLLHLANEEGLRIETARFDGRDGDEGSVGEFKGSRDGAEGEGEGRKGCLDDVERRDRVVGELQALRVWKDPDAGRAA